MKLGVNMNVNPGTKKASLRPIAGGPSKTNPPDSHPSNPIHKEATQAQGLGKKNNKKTKGNDALALKPLKGNGGGDTGASDVPAPTQTDLKVEQHHINKAIIATGAIALVGLVVWMR